LQKSSTSDASITKAAQVIWEFMLLRHPLQKGEVVIAMGSHDLRTATHAAKLVLDGWGETLLCSGGCGRLTRGIWQENEAERFAQAAVTMGVPRETILIEDQSSNTGENIAFSLDLLSSHSMQVSSLILVHKPYMERRVYATAKKIWPMMQFAVSSPPIPFEDYPTQAIPREDVIAIMVGDFQRLMVYPEKGYAIPQEIPPPVMEAYQRLVAAGFRSHLIKNG